MILPPEPAPTLKRPLNPRLKVTLKLTLVFLGILLLGIVLFFMLHVSPDRTLVWLTPAEFRQTTRPGIFTRIKYDIINLTGPFLRGFFRYRPQINIDSSLMAVSAAASEATDLGNPTATNTAGLRAWVLSPNDLQRFQRGLKTNPDAAVVSRPRISTANGIQAQLSVGQSAPAGGKSIPVGLTIEIMPKVANGSLKLLVRFVSTEKAASPRGDSAFIRTNLAVSCQALLPNGGALVVDGGSATPASGTNYWLIVSPTAIDARGQPIKL